MPEATTEQTPTYTPFDDAAWSATPPEPVAAETAPAQEAAAVELPTEQASAATVTEAATEQPATTNSIKEKFGVESLDEVHAEMERLRQGTTTKEELQFQNEQSRKVFDYLREGKVEEVYGFLDTQKKLSSVETLEADRVIRMQLELNNPHYTAADIEDIMEERYLLPPKPVQSLEEDDAEFQQREQQWKAQQEKVQRKMNRDAVEAKAALLQMKQELVLPDIAPKVDPKVQEAQQKELERLDTLRATYLKSLESDYQKFDGFKAEYKDEEVSIPVSYVVTEEERLSQKEALQAFDVDGFISQRWFTPDGMPNINQMQSDIYLLQNREKVFSKLVNEAGKQRLAEHLKRKSNINVEGTRQHGSLQPGKTLQEQVWS